MSVSGQILRIQVLILWISIFSGGILKAGGIEFFNGTFEEAKAAAQQQGKLIFVDAYAVWCGPCKKMAASVFPLEEVGEVFNAHYISMKIDMERGEGLVFREKYPVTAFPTLFFMNDQGEILERVVGAKSGPDLIQLGQKHSRDRKPTKNLASSWEQGDRSPEVAAEYIEALYKLGKNTLPIANDFLATQPDLTNEYTLKAIFYGSQETDSKVFEQLIENRKAIEALMTKEAVEGQIIAAALKTVIKAADYDYEELLESAKEVVRKQVPSKSKVFEGRADVNYYAIIRQEKSFLNAAEQYLKTDRTSPLILQEITLLADKHFARSKGAQFKALEWAEQYGKTANTAESWMLHAKIAERLNQIEVARSSASKAFEQAKSAGEPTWQIEKMINNLQLR
jgi:thiol-disulfide isomerase/thioredoxin